MRSVEDGVFDAFDNAVMTEAPPLLSQTLLVALSGFAFAVPAVACWRLGRIWHMCVYGILAVVCSWFNFCTAAAADGLHYCSADLTVQLSRAHVTWAYFSLLQTALIILGPEDPLLQSSVEVPTAKGAAALASTPPRDVIALGRAVPLTLLCALNFARSFPSWSQVHWENWILTEQLLIACTAFFWIQQRRLVVAPLLRRLKYWRRLWNHGLIPVVMVCWLCCIIGRADNRSMRPLTHVIIAGYVISTLKAAHPDIAERPSGAEVFDPSGHNPDVSHLLLGGVAAVVLPSMSVALLYDWCGDASAGRRTLFSAVTSCQPGGHFAASAGALACVFGGIAFMLIDSDTSCPWNALRSQRLLEDGVAGQRFGCMLGFAGCASGLLGTLAMHDSPRHGALVFWAGLASLVALAPAMAVTLLWSDPRAPGYRTRHIYTFLICEPLVLVGRVQPNSGR